MNKPPSCDQSWCSWTSWKNHRVGDLANDRFEQRYLQPSLIATGGIVLKFIFISIIATGMSMSCVASEKLAKSRDGTLLVESLPESVEKEFEGCACTFNSPGNHSLTALAWDYSSQQASAAMQINGRTERLSLVGERSRRKKGNQGEPQEGDSTEYKFSSDSVSTTLGCKVSKTCWGTPGCEYIAYSCSAQVRANGVQVRLPVNGGCGC